MGNLLRIENLYAYYGDAEALHGVDIAVKDGGICALLGANGAGKTTTLRAICSLVRTTGSITFDGRKIDGWMTEDIIRLGVAHVPEGRGTFSSMTVRENLRLGAYLRGGKAFSADLDEICHYFPRLKERLHQQAFSLSGGEQQMLAISRALLCRPRLMLLDEPW